MFVRLFLSTLLLLFLSCSNNQTGTKAKKNAPPAVSLSVVAENLQMPIALVPVQNDDRLFIVELTGKIKILKNGQVQSKPFLDVSSRMAKVDSTYTEKGLLGLAFHPKFNQNGKFYIYYSRDVSGRPGVNHLSRISEFRVSKLDPNEADPNSERVIMEIDQPEENHNGGHIAFGPDGYLYIGMGDGGGAGDEHGTTGNGQNPGTLLGKMLRIDVDTTSGYKIPRDNPFVNQANTRPEIWAIGLRNPWKFAFDHQGRLFCADVGQNRYEEVNLIEGGKNYGWRIMEGNHCFNPMQNCNEKGLTKPIFNYSHELGSCIIGGFFYEGKAISSLNNHFIFGDLQLRLFSIKENNFKEWQGDTLAITGSVRPERYCLSMGIDAKGELYMLCQTQPGFYSYSGKIYKLIPAR
jgi:glucose/arabinose dehydrogenase